ncbi:MAG: ferritin [Bacteroidota bacterium]
MLKKNHFLRIPREVVEMLNEQIAQENLSSFAYLSQAVWCDRRGYQGAAKFLYKQSADEREHMLRIMAYLNELEAEIMVPTQQKVDSSHASLQDIFTEVLANEVKVTASIHTIVEYVLKVKDYRTFSFLQWFLEEQREEERIAQRAVELFDIMGKDGGVGQYMIDQALGELIEEDEASMDKLPGE